MPLPNFLCVGTQKAGTSTLQDILVQHPDIFLPAIKETRFFRDDSEFAKGTEYYQNEFFSTVRGEKAVGEIDPDYMYFEHVPGRIHECLDTDIRFIFLLRNPVDRAYSHYWMSYYRGYDRDPFTRSIELEEDRIKIGFFERNQFSYIDRGHYAEQIERYLRFFPKQNMLFLVFEEDFRNRSSREKSIGSILEFLDLQHLELNVDIRSNPSSRPKYQFIRDIIYGRPAPLRFLASVVVPSAKWRQRVALLVDQKNRVESRPPALLTELREEIWNRHFKQDVGRLELLLNRELKSWYPYDSGSDSEAEDRTELNGTK